MKIKSIISILLGGLFISIFGLSNAMAEEVYWLNNYKFIGGQNVKVSHGSSFEYPGSIIVDVIPQDEPVVEVVDGDIAEIFKRIEVQEETDLTCVTVCFREDTPIAPFGIKI